MEFVLTSVVRAELEALTRRRPRGRAKTAQQVLASLHNLGVLTTAEPVSTDEVLLQTALRTGYGVATLDGELLQRLRALKIPVLTLRAGRLMRRNPG